MSVVIVDDHERERSWLRELVTDKLPDLMPIYEASNGSDAVSLAIAHAPRVVFLDIDMPGISGIKAAENIVRERPQTGIIIFSHHSDEIWVRQLWKVMPAEGAFAYLLKDSSDTQLVEATQSVLAGDCWIHPKVQKVVRRLHNTATGLSDAEFEVLAYISLGLTDRGIATRLFITEKAVQSRLKCLYTKLGIPLKGSGPEDEFNHRCRAINLGVRRGLVNKQELDEWESRVSAQVDVKSGS